MRSGRATTSVFIASALLISVLVVIAGWLTDLQAAAHAALLSAMTFAFLPFVIIAVGIAGVLLLVLFSALLGLLGGEVDLDADLFAEGISGGLRLIRPYYRFLAKRGHPAFWGALFGVVLGGGVLTLLVGYARLPGEARTAEQLALCRVKLEAHHKAKGKYPRPTKEGHLELDGAVVVDGFGRPMRYRRSFGGVLASYRLTSLGYDGALSSDDLCLFSGRWKGLLEKLEKKVGPLPFSKRLEHLEKFQCPTASE